MRSYELDSIVLKHVKHYLSRLGCAPILALSLLVTGCATTTTVTDTQLLQVRSYATTAVLAGRLSIRYDVNGTEQASHGSFTWNQHNEHTTVQLLSPLGQIVAVITISPDQATLTQSNHAEKTAEDPDTLIHDVIGWPLPINGLHYWLQGFSIERSGKPFPVKAANEPVTMTTPDAWHITYASWEPDSNNALRPKRIDLSRNTKEAGTVAIRIVIDEWQTR